MSTWKGWWQEQQKGRNLRQTAGRGGSGPQPCLGVKGESRAVSGDWKCGVLHPAGRPGSHNKFRLNMLTARSPGVTATEHCAGHINRLEETDTTLPISYAGKLRLREVT